MRYYLEFRYQERDEDEPIIFSSLKELITELLEWYQFISYIARSFRSTSRIVQMISPNKLMLSGIEGEIVVYRVVSPILYSEVIVYAK